MNVEKADSVKMSVERNLILTHSEKNVRSQQATVNPNVERMVTLIEGMGGLRELLERDCTNIRSDLSVNIAKLTKAVQGLSSLVFSKGLEL